MLVLRNILAPKISNLYKIRVIFNEIVVTFDRQFTVVLKSKAVSSDPTRPNQSNIATYTKKKVDSYHWNYNLKLNEHVESVKGGV